MWGMISFNPRPTTDSMTTSKISKVLGHITRTVVVVMEKTISILEI
jgi:hypothetical protein